MCIRIGIEDLVANALIELAEKKDQREVYFKDLDKYGAVVVKLLNKEDEKAVLILSTERTNNFLIDYSEYYELFSLGKEEGIRLKEDVEVDELWSKFRSYLSVKVMKAFMNKESVQALGV
ncbi:hypothetical protein [Blautia sp. HCP3S3_C4]|uniref:hypothetical protein n=1 Tax=Blautia sp. HCP3S3_C4 TaxID=3438911 RepID=UPI003F8AA08A